MAQSLRNFYARRGLTGHGLGHYAANLQATALRLKAQGLAPCEIKRALVAEQAPLLLFQGRYIPKNESELPFLTMNNWESVFSRSTLSPSKAAFAKRLQAEGKTLLHSGEVGFQEHYGGQGERLKIRKAKYLATPDDLRIAYHAFLERSGIDRKSIPALPPLADWTIGERNFLGKAFELYADCKAAGKSESEIKTIFSRIKFKMVLSQNAGAEIVENLVKNNFFGFAPGNFIFMYQPQHPTFGVTETGELEPDLKYPTQGNHGLTTFHSLLPNQWFRVVPGEAPGSYREERLTTEDYKLFQRGLKIILFESVEDLSQYEHPIDYGFIGKIARQGETDGTPFFQQIMKQKKEYPQPGGVFAHLFDKRTRLNRNAIVESNRTSLKPEEILLINRGWGGVWQPNTFDSLVVDSPMLDDLHPTFKPKGEEPVVRIESEIPFGDPNLYLPTVYYVLNRTLANLKVPGDIPAARQAMQQMETRPGLYDFARSFLGLERNR